MRRIHWGLLWLGTSAGLAGCYGNMNPGSATSADNSLPIDTALYEPHGPTKLPPIVYHSQLHMLDKPLQYRPTPIDTNVTARAWMLEPGMLRQSGPSTLTAPRRVRSATDSGLQAMSPVVTQLTSTSRPPKAVLAKLVAAPATPVPAEAAVGSVRVQRDGDVKLKDTAGNKLKVDADDGTIKQKPASGGKTKIK